MKRKIDKTTFYCNECGYESNKWLGQCPTCKSWDTFIEIKNDEDNVFNFFKNKNASKPVSLDEIETKNEVRIKTGLKEFDNLLGGGFVKGSINLIGGPPGIGKSTLLLQISKKINNYNILYVSGEESLKQIKIRAERIEGVSNNVKFLSETDLNEVIKICLNDKPDLLLIDSIQTMNTDNIAHKNPGSISEVKNACSLLFRLSKEYAITSILTCHITKDGSVAGPMLLEHMVDTVLYFEDDQIKNLRLIRCIKNRYNSIDTLAVFEMTGYGLKEIENPSEIFLDGKNIDATGSVVTCIVELNKPILLEVQALVTKTNFGLPTRKVDGFDINRLNLLIAIIEKRMNIPLFQYDIYANITGGLKIKDNSIDLAIIMAIISSYKEKVLGTDVIYCGEVGLSGEIRSIRNVNLRLKEAVKLGYKKIFLPKSNQDNIDKNFIKNNDGFEIKYVESVTG